jgi:tetratricopeptide (TPR) repeat protein
MMRHAGSTGPRTRRVAAVLAALVLGLARARAADAPSEPSPGLWKDPAFQKAFLGSYGVQSELEPKMTQIEVLAMQKVLPLMDTDPEAAARKLKGLAKPNASGVFDFTLGNLAFSKDQPEEAAAHYRTAIGKFPNFRRALRNLGLIQVRLGQYDDAVRSLSRVIELGGGEGLTYGLLGYSYAATGHSMSAESSYRNAVLLQPDLLDWKVGLAQTLLKQQKHADAAALCGELLERYPDRTDLWLLQAGAYVGMGQPLKAAENYEILRRMGKGTVASLATLGDIYVNEGLWDLAASAYGAALDADPQQDAARPLRWIAVLAQRGATAQARALADRCKTTYGDRLDAAARKDLLKQEARIAATDGADAEALTALQEIVALDPLDGEALLLLGQHYTRADDLEQAQFYYERAESLEPFEAEAKVRRAQILVRQSKYKDAIPLLKRAQELKPRDDVARYLEQVERLARTRS